MISPHDPAPSCAEGFSDRAERLCRVALGLVAPEDAPVALPRTVADVSLAYIPEHHIDHVQQSLARILADADRARALAAASARAGPGHEANTDYWLVRVAAEERRLWEYLAALDACRADALRIPTRMALPAIHYGCAHCVEQRGALSGLSCALTGADALACNLQCPAVRGAGVDAGWRATVGGSA